MEALTNDIILESSALGALNTLESSVLGDTGVLEVISELAIHGVTARWRWTVKMFLQGYSIHLKKYNLTTEKLVGYILSALKMKKSLVDGEPSKLDFYMQHHGSNSDSAYIVMDLASKEEITSMLASYGVTTRWTYVSHRDYISIAYDLTNEQLTKCIYRELSESGRHVDGETLTIEIDYYRQRIYWKYAQ